MARFRERIETRRMPYRLGICCFSPFSLRYSRCGTATTLCTGPFHRFPASPLTAAPNSWSCSSPGKTARPLVKLPSRQTKARQVPRSDRPLQTWKTFLSNHMEGIASIDLFVVPTIAFQRLFAFLVLGLERRRLLWFAVTRNPTADWLARQITEAFPWDGAPKYLIRDNDRVFGVVFKAHVRAMGIRDKPTSFRSPWQNGYVERLIGSIRRECTDHLLVFNAEHLRRILAKYATYYNEVRTHVSLGKDAPCRRPVERFGNIVAYPVLGGLHHRYARI